jgi:mannose-6-phosphate isomerase-like protein (cupin superfamily)
MTGAHTDYRKYIFQDRSGWIVGSRMAASSHSLLGLGHTACIEPWTDASVHLHTDSEEFYLLRGGELKVYIAGALVTLQPGELLMVLPRVPHAIVGGQGTIEHFGIRAPFLDDKKVVSEIPVKLPARDHTERELRAAWGSRIPLTAPENQNCWLIGWGAARYLSQHLIFAYLNFPTQAAANAGIGTRLRMHYHRDSWEYYVALKGSKVLQIEEELVNMEAGEIVEVPPKVRHNVYSREAPYEGFAIRVPVRHESDKVEDSR